jgi:hypothetical protein
MPIIRVTRKQIQAANKAGEAALYDLSVVRRLVLSVPASRYVTR